MRTRIARLGPLAGLSLLASLTGAGAQEGMFMKNILGEVGIIPKARPPINYRERAPLVLPPRTDLPEPAETAGLAAHDAQWPNDPDVRAAQRRAAEANIPVTQTERRRLEQNPTLSVEEIRAGRRPGAQVPTAPVVRPGDNSRDGYWVHPDQLRAQGRKDAQSEAVLAGVEPDRQTLTEPPTGFRRSASGAPIKRDFEPIQRDDEADPKAYLRDQAKRR
jgi:hypothetical protein